MEEFEVGDTVEIVKPCKCNYWDEGQKPCEKDVLGHKGKITRIYHSGDERPYVVKIPVDSHCSFRKDQLKLIERGKSMSKHDELKARIEKVEAWDKGADDILGEISKRHSILVLQNDSADVRYIEVEAYGGGKMAFNFTSQCEKLEAFKKALMWLLDRSDVKKGIVGTKQEIKLEGKVYEAEIIREV